MDITNLKHPEDVRCQNTRLILSVLRHQDSLSRTLITQQTGLSAATVSTISSKLLRQNILRTQDGTGHIEPKISRGRPQVTLSLNPDVGCVVIVNLSFNHLDVTVLDYTGQIRAKASDAISTLHMSEEDLVYSLTRMINSLISQGSTPRMPLRYIAMGVQGVVDAHGKTMLWSPIIPLKNLPFSDILHKAFQVPVWIANDCNVMVEALASLHPDQYKEDFAVILLGQGIGMGLMSNGRRFVGRQSSAVEFGHMAYRPNSALCRCGQLGCVEAYAGDYAIWRRAKGLEEHTTPVESFDPALLNDILKEARSNENGLEREAYREAGEALGHGLRSLFALIDPVPVAFVGHGTPAFDLLEPSIREALERSGMMLDRARIHINCYEDSASLIRQGCAVIAFRALDKQFSKMS